ncbi:hypothetical protein AB5I41_19865 [Sphingomonas sp. MMS24-JH45]
MRTGARRAAGAGDDAAAGRVGLATSTGTAFKNAAGLAAGAMQAARRVRG